MDLRVLMLLAASTALSNSGMAQTDWQSLTPQEAGLDASKLELLERNLAERHTTALLIVRRGKIVLEWYAPGSTRDKPQGTASLAKALVGGLSLLVATNDGHISPDDLASKYIPSWKDDSDRARITIRELATHTSGIEDAEQGNLAHDKLTGWKGAFWRRDPNPISIAIHDAPVVFEPGTRFAYSNPGMAALAYAVTASLKGTAVPDIQALLDARVMQPLGIAKNEWSIGYGHAYKTDGLNVYANWGGAAFTPRAAAKMGSLMLHRGEWNHQQLIARQAVDRALAEAGPAVTRGSQDANAPVSSLGWWINTNGGWEGVPKDAFGGAGAGHKVLMVVPSLDLIVIRDGDSLDPQGRDGFWPPAVRYLLRPLIQAISNTNAYPPSPAIRGIRFAGEETIVRKAIDSDNWPITWGVDDHQYTAYGDGQGFDPKAEKKLSQGFARVEGPADNFEGFNIRSVTGERTGNGANGLKASGLLMVDSVLYLGCATHKTRS